VLGLSTTTPLNLKKTVLALKSQALNSKSSAGHLAVETISRFKIQMTETNIAGRGVIWYFEFWLFEFV
jgi:hypothetical protein